MADSPETKNKKDQDPRPLSPEQLEEFKFIVHTKAKAARKTHRPPKKNPEDPDKTFAMWTPSPIEQVHIEIGATHEPDYVEVLLINGPPEDGAGTETRKHFRYFPIAGVSEYEEETVEYFNGKRLTSEEHQEVIRIASQVDQGEIDWDEVIRIAREHAKDSGNRYVGGVDIKPMDEANLKEVLTALSRCNLSNEVPAPRFEEL